MIFFGVFSKAHQDTLRCPQAAPKIRPRRFQKAPRGVQEAPKRRPRSPKMRPKAHKKLPRGPQRGTQTASKSYLSFDWHTPWKCLFSNRILTFYKIQEGSWGSLGASWAPLGGILRTFWGPFGVLWALGSAIWSRCLEKRKGGLNSLTPFGSPKCHQGTPKRFRKALQMRPRGCQETTKRAFDFKTLKSTKMMTT